MEKANSSEAIVINNSTEPCIDEQELPMSEWLIDSTVGLPNHFSCVVCKETLPSKDALNEHQSVHDKDKEDSNDSMTSPCCEERTVKRARVRDSHSNFDNDDGIKGNEMTSTAESVDVKGASSNCIVVIDEALGNEECGLDLALKL